MANPVDFCTCTYYACPNHPRNQDRGCTPCIEKNLRQGEIPECMFNAACDPADRTGEKYMDFARAVMARRAEQAP